MSSNDLVDQTNPNCRESKIDEQWEPKICVTNVFIPKVEPCYTNISKSNEDILSTFQNEAITWPVPFSIPYKIKDPTVLVERCDKIWETLQFIKNVQDKKRTNTLNNLSVAKPNSESYIEYQPVLCNNNAALPNFKFSVKSKKKLFQCSTCGKLYTKNIYLRQHAEKVHNIFIPPLRIRHSSVFQKNANGEKRKEKEKEKEQVKEQEVEKVEEGNTSEEETQGQSNVVMKDKVQPNNSVNRNEISQKESERRITNKKHHDPTLLTCVLCKHVVKDIRKHLIDYHKIESSDFMLKELKKTSTVREFKELGNTFTNDKYLREHETIQKHSSHNHEKQKRKLSMLSHDPKKKCKTNTINETVQKYLSWKSTQQCEICLGVYNRKSFNRHLRSHHARGETQENIHLFGYKYLNSPLFLTQREITNMNDVSSKTLKKFKHKDKCGTDLLKKKEMEQTSQNLSESKEKCDTNGNNKFETQCSSSKVFQDSHTLCLHKKNCNAKNSRVCTVESNSDTSVPYCRQSSSDKDSGAGINITIKKKNNSYEIVGKEPENKLNDCNYSKNVDSKHENKLGDSNHSKNTVVETSIYSKDHSIVKIQPIKEHVDVDIDIDIEEESEIKSWNSNINESDDVSIEEEKQEVNSVQDQEDKSNVLHEKVLQPEQCNINKYNIYNRYNMCVCGSKFYNKKAFNIHINKHLTNSELMCGYCKVKFASIGVWIKHHCSVEGDKKFIDLPLEISCSYCSITVHTFKQFDKHVNLKHFDPILPYQCFGCYKRFYNITSRKIHFDTEHGISVCSICQKKIRHNTKSRHEGYHYGLGFPCHLCKTAYSSKYRLSKHKYKVHYRVIHNTIINSNKPLFLNSRNNNLYKRSLRHHNKNVETEC